MSQPPVSVEDLNKKAWFRLLKVLYASAFIVIALFLLRVAQQSAYVEDQASLTAAQLFASGTELLPPQVITQEYPRTHPTIYDSLTNTPQPPSPTYHENWLDFPLPAIVLLLIEMISFWLIRRVFYYVVLGTPMWRGRKGASGRANQ